MVRVSKKDRLKRCPRKPHYGSVETGPVKDVLPVGYREHENAFNGEGEVVLFIGKVK